MRFTTKNGLHNKVKSLKYQKIVNQIRIKIRKQKLAVYN